jgi:Tol biopolymer transport system component
LGSVGEPAQYNNIALSPDEARLVVIRLDDGTAANDMWMLDLKSGGSSRFTFDAADELNPVWSPAGDKLAFGSRRKGPIDLYAKPVSGNGDAELLLDSGEMKIPHAWSPKGDLLLYTVDTAGWALPLTGGRKPYALPHTTERADFSPNGRWVAYQVNESGRFDVYVESVPASGGKWQVSKAGGTEPLWSRDRRELYYVDNANNLTVVTVETDQSVFRSSSPKTLFALRPFPTGGRRYQVASNGQRFLVNNPIETPQQPITVFVNWMAGLKKP